MKWGPSRHSIIDPSAVKTPFPLQEHFFPHFLAVQRRGWKLVKPGIGLHGIDDALGVGVIICRLSDPRIEGPAPGPLDDIHLLGIGPCADGPHDIFNIIRVYVIVHDHHIPTEVSTGPSFLPFTWTMVPISRCGSAPSRCFSSPIFSACSIHSRKSLNGTMSTPIKAFAINTCFSVFISFPREKTKLLKPGGCNHCQ